MYSKLIFPLDPNDSVLLEIPVIISQGVSQKYRLALNDLIYVEACQHRLILHTIQGDFTTRCTFADLTVCLTPSDRFFHGGKGLLINFAHVSLVQVTGEVLLKNGQIIFCSRRRRRETREAFLVYAGAGKFSQRISGRKTASAHVQRTYPGRTDLYYRRPPARKGENDPQNRPS